MALKIQFIFKDGTQLDTLVADASLKETHSFAAVVTDFPVEQGSAVTDNIRAEPISLRVEAFFSDFPLGNAGRAQSSSGGIQGTQRVSARTEGTRNILDKLRRLQTEGVVVSIDTGLRAYENMVLESLEIPRDKDVAGGLRANMTFKEIRFAKSATVQVAAQPKGQNKRPGGPKNGKKAEQESEAERRVREKYQAGLKVFQ